MRYRGSACDHELAALGRRAGRAIRRPVRTSAGVLELDGRSKMPSAPPARDGHSTSSSAVLSQLVPQAEMLDFGGNIDAVEVAMRDVARSPRQVRLDERVGRTAHGARVTERVQQPCDEGGLAGTKLALQSDQPGRMIVSAASSARPSSAPAARVASAVASSRITTG